MKTWNEAARFAVQKIYWRAAEVSENAKLYDVRECLDRFIELIMQPQGPAAMSKENRETCWIELGALGMHAGHTQSVGDGLGFMDYLHKDDLLLKTLVRKQADYGPENIARFGTTGLVVRMHDKIARLENLTSNLKNPWNESMIDNFMDVIGYAAVGILWETDTFLLPLEDFESPATA